MKRLTLLWLALYLNFAVAEGGFVGGGLSLYGFLPMLSVQAGVDIAQNVTLRGNLDSLILVNVLSGDLLYTFPETPFLYAGGGPDMIVLLNPPPESGYPNVFFGLHGTLGVQLHQEAGAYFFELQPALGFLDASQRYVKFRAGFDYYF